MPEKHKAAPTFFATPAEFRAWLPNNYDKASELLIARVVVPQGGNLVGHQRQARRVAPTAAGDPHH